MSLDEHQPRGVRRRRRSAEERAAVDSARRVVDPEGQRWIVRHEGADALLQSWWWFAPPLLGELLLWRRAQKHGWSAIYADSASGAIHRVALGRHVSVLEGVDQVASAIEKGDPMPTRIDG